MLDRECAAALRLCHLGLFVAGVAAACPDRPPFVLAQRGHLIREAGLLPGAACLTLPRYKGDLR